MKWKSWHILAILSCVLWLAYYPALSAPLNSVDDARLAHDLLNRTSFSWQDFWLPRSKSYYRPLINSSFILDQLLWGFEESFLHLENVLLHWLNTLLVFFLAGRFARWTGLSELVVPAIAAAIFGLHPINSEAVIWIAGRADLLATTFVLLVLLSMVHFLQSGKTIWLLATALAFFAGSLAKETAILVLPGLLAFGWVAYRAQIPKAIPLFKAWLPAIVSLLPLAGYAVLRTLALRGGDLGTRHVVEVVKGMSPTVSAPQQLPAATASQWPETLQVVLKGVGFYSWKLIQPFPLNFGIVEVDSGYLWLGCLVILLFILLLARLTWWSSFVLCAMSLASVALLVALGNISWTPFAERYMYAPSAMLSLGVSLGGSRIITKLNCVAWETAAIAALSLLMLLSTWTIHQRAVVWQDNLTLFADTVEKSPGFAMAQNELALALWNRGRKTEAIEILRRVETPQSQVAFLNRALILVEEGKLAEARQFLLESLSRKETSAYHRAILERLVDIVERQRRVGITSAQRVAYDDEIIDYLQKLWRLTGDPFYLYRLGNKQMEKGDLSQARQSFSLAYSKFPPESIYREPSRKLAEKLSEP